MPVEQHQGMNEHKVKKNSRNIPETESYDSQRSSWNTAPKEEESL